MDYQVLKKRFDNGIGSPYPFEPFFKYLNLLLDWNRKINLTGTDDPGRIIEENFIDSLQAAQFIGSKDTVLDIGSGAGFPGLPLKIIKPGTDLVIYESIKKKADFIKMTIRELGIKDALVKNERFRSGIEKARFDRIVSRGTFSILTGLEMTKEMLTGNSSFIFFKGGDIEHELAEASDLLIRLSLKLSTYRYKLRYSNKDRQLLIVSKEI